MQLAFVLFTQIHNFSALEAYKRLLSLVAHAQNFFLPSNPGCLHFARQLIQTVLTPQFRSLRDEFFTLDLPELDAYFLSELGQLRTCLNEAAKAWRSSTSPNERAEWSEFVSGIWQPFVDFVASKFAWQLGSLDEFADVKGKTLHYNLLQEDDLLAEEGEDAPQVVDVDDFDAI
jgi:A1 cistron-splicing factor AAR2